MGEGLMGIVKGGIVEEFINWFHSRGEYYAKLPVKYYMDGEPYFSDQGAECSLRDYLKVKADREKEILKAILATPQPAGGMERREG